MINAPQEGAGISSRKLNPIYCGGCWGGVGGAAVFGFFDRRGLAFIIPPPVVKETFCGSPGTLVSVNLSPTFFARNETVIGGFAPDFMGSPIMTVTAV